MAENASNWRNYNKKSIKNKVNAHLALSKFNATKPNFGMQTAVRTWVCAK